jgi:hypothetical protein
MRTTIDIPDSLYRTLKSRAAAEGTSVKAIVLRSVERDLNRPLGGNRTAKRLPVIKSTAPGTLDLTKVNLYDDVYFP